MATKFLRTFGVPALCGFFLGLSVIASRNPVSDSVVVGQLLAGMALATILVVKLFTRVHALCFPSPNPPPAAKNS